jgi:hypothetical protein
MTGLWKEWKAKQQASHSSHEPLGNLAKNRRDFHIPTAPTTKADGKVENQNQVSHFPTASVLSLSRQKQGRGGLRPSHRSGACVGKRAKNERGPN